MVPFAYASPYGARGEPDDSHLSGFMKQRLAHTSMTDEEQVAALERIVKFLDKFEPILERLLANPMLRKFGVK